MRHDNQIKTNSGTLPEQGIRILIADDHVLLGDVLTLALEKAGYSVEFVTSYYDALNELKSDAPPDLLLLDKHMPGMSGIPSVKQAVLTNKKTKVVLFSSCIRPHFVLACLSAGAWGYVSKSTSLLGVVDALSKILKGNLYLPEKVRQELKGIEKHPDQVVYTSEDMRLLNLVAEGFSDKEIAEFLGVSPAKSKRMVKSIVDKLSAKNRIVAVMKAKEDGLI
ncbi:response regulator transcription factor [Pelagimonas varians]|uniref:Transcriptional regulatory protein DegU n=1 Tax=Pelagimonas varians TaxID=696760 RepID=A0A238KET0_9RHOB|nr:response regulator transcription factor [Pelagimonas varians]PYG32430.1 LuxR family two component transcriptional regulator [Pelagimonas varians]SMX41353.1 Transcriptional regulatory protein DegU [Pelagimonas varians]